MGVGFRRRSRPGIVGAGRGGLTAVVQYPGALLVMEDGSMSVFHSSWLDAKLGAINYPDFTPNLIDERIRIWRRSSTGAIGPLSGEKR